MPRQYQGMIATIAGRSLVQVPQRMSHYCWSYCLHQPKRRRRSYFEEKLLRQSPIHKQTRRNPSRCGEKPVRRSRGALVGARRRYEEEGKILPLASAMPTLQHRTQNQPPNFHAPAISKHCLVRLNKMSSQRFQYNSS
jgi:hypothetical protein